MSGAWLRADGAGEVERWGPWGQCALGHELSSFVLGQVDDEAYLPGCSWQKPYPTQKQEKVDKHQRPVISSNHLIRALMTAWGHPKWGIPVKTR